MAILGRMASRRSASDLGGAHNRADWSEVMRDDSTVALNRKARHEFTIDDTFEAGLVLTGTEIKSIRAGKANIAECLRAHRAGRGVARRRPHRAVRAGQSGQPRPEADPQAAAPSRQIDELLGKTKAKGQTIVPLRLYITPRQGQARARPRARQAAPRQAPRHRRPRRQARDRAPARRRRSAVASG